MDSENQDIFSHLEDNRQSSLTPANPNQHDVPNNVVPTESISASRLKNNLLRLSGSITTGLSFADLIAAISTSNKLCWLINAKAAGLDVANMVAMGAPNLLEQLGEEIISTNSLHLIQHIQSELFVHINKALAADAAICIAMNSEFTDFQKEVVPTIAWFLKPSSLKLHLENGSGLLLDQIFSATNLVLTFDAGEGSWDLFLHPKETRDWQQLGLPFAPTLKK